MIGWLKEKMPRTKNGQQGGIRYEEIPRPTVVCDLKRCHGDPLDHLRSLLRNGSGPHRPHGSNGAGALCGHYGHLVGEICCPLHPLFQKPERLTGGEPPQIVRTAQKST